MYEWMLVLVINSGSYKAGDTVFMERFNQSSECIRAGKIVKNIIGTTDFTCIEITKKGN